MSDSDTQELAKEGAKIQAVRAEQEKAGVFVSSNTKIKNHMVESDEIETFTASIVKFIGEPNFEPVLIQGKDGKTYIKFIATVTVAIDTDDLNAQIDKWLKRNNPEHSEIAKQNDSMQKIISNQAKKIEQLEEIIATASTAKNSNAAIKNNSSPTMNLPIEESKLNYYNTTLAEFNKAVRLHPNNDLSYYNRGKFYQDFKQYGAAIADYNRALELNPNYANSYYNRGICYLALKKELTAAKDFEMARKLR